VRSLSFIPSANATLITNFKHPILHYLDGIRRKQLSLDVFVPDHQIGIIWNASNSSYEKTLAAASLCGVSILRVSDISVSSLQSISHFLGAKVAKKQET
jgi:hypothetical protein